MEATIFAWETGASMATVNANLQRASTQLMAIKISGVNIQAPPLQVYAWQRGRLQLVLAWICEVSGK